MFESPFSVNSIARSVCQTVKFFRSRVGGVFGVDRVEWSACGNGAGAQRARTPPGDPIRPLRSLTQSPSTLSTTTHPAPRSCASCFPPRNQRNRIGSPIGSRQRFRDWGKWECERKWIWFLYGFRAATVAKPPLLLGVVQHKSWRVCFSRSVLILVLHCSLTTWFSAVIF